MRDIVAYPSFLELKLPDFSRTMVSLVNAPKAIGPCGTRNRSALETECAGVPAHRRRTRRRVRRVVIDRAVARHRRRGDADEHYPHH